MQITFYILGTHNSQQAWLFTSKLLEAVYAKQQAAHIFMNNRDEAKKLDQFLWTYRDDSFLPHALAKENIACPILILDESLSADSPKETLLNLSEKIPPDYQTYTHLIEIIYNQPNIQQLARERYKTYRDQGHDIQTIKE